ncbi:hypothetical protein QF032_001072 [Streptomyces achromogenes]|nr:hypothetical protein [Streptomyces achromogenes]
MQPWSCTGRDGQFSCRCPASRSGRNRSRTHASQSRWEENAPRYGRMSGCDRKSGTRESHRHTDSFEAPTASCAPARSTSRRSRTKALRCGFDVSRIRAETPPGRTSAGPRHITRVSHSHHQLGRRSRTKRLRPAISCPQWTGIDAPGRSLQPVPGGTVNAGQADAATPTEPPPRDRHQSRSGPVPGRRSRQRSHGCHIRRSASCLRCTTSRRRICWGERAPHPGAALCPCPQSRAAKPGRPIQSGRLPRNGPEPISPKMSEFNGA